MSRQETVNTFTDGLVMDLNPITTPNSVLTNALNATLITYNGNEFVLQNDMGNGRVETAYLPAGYVPVGIKEYGGIIYVASYNPLTNKGQIGSFPSPERNISSNEIQGAQTILSPSSFDMASEGVLETFVSKINIFPEGTIIRSGDKFTLMFDGSRGSQINIDILKTYLSSCFNSEEGKLSSPKNKLLTLTLTVSDSNGYLRDITNQLKRFDEDNKTISFKESDAPLYKTNAGFFIQAMEKDFSSDVDSYRKNYPANVYNNKLSGELILVASLNIIDSIDVAVTGYVKPDDVQESEPYNVPNDSGILIPQGFKYSLIYDIQYKYNCPDGYFGIAHPNNYEEVLKDYKSYYGIEKDFGNHKNVIQGCEFNLVSPSKSPIQGHVDFSNNENPPVYNINSKQYSRDQSVQVNLPSINNTIINYSVTPCMTYSRLKGLTVDNTIDLSKLGSGIIELNVWKYYCNDTSVILTWGMQAYLVEGTSISKVTLNFYKFPSANKGVPTSTYVIPPKRNYNGVFTDVLRFGDVLEVNNIYLVEIIKTIKTGNSEKDSEPEYRWLISSPLYNKVYSLVRDYNLFSSDEVKEYNSVDIIATFSNTFTRNVEQLQRDGGVELFPIVKKGENAPEKFDIKGSTAYTFEYSMEDNYDISTPTNYPFSLNQDSISVTYKCENSKYSTKREDYIAVGNINAPNDFVVNSDFSKDSNIISGGIYDSHKFKLSSSGSKITLFGVTMSQFSSGVSNNTKYISYTNVFKSFVNDMAKVFGTTIYSQNGNYFSNFEFGTHVYSSGGRRIAYIDTITRTNSSQKNTTPKWKSVEIYSDRNSGRQLTFSNYLDRFMEAVDAAFPAQRPSCIVFGTISESNNQGYKYPGSHDATHVAELVSGKNLASFQILLWYNGTSYVWVNDFGYNSSNASGGSDKFISDEMTNVVYKAFKQVYVQTKDTYSENYYIYDSSGYVYNPDVTLTLVNTIPCDCTIKTDKLLKIGESFVSKKSIENFVNKFGLEDKYISLMTFYVNDINSNVKYEIDGENEFILKYSTILTTDLMATSMESVYASLNNFAAQSGTSTSLGLIDEAGKFHSADGNSSTFVSGKIYYNESGKFIPIEQSSGANLVKNLKYSNGTLLVNSTDGSTKDFGVFRDSFGDGDISLHFNGLPVVNIPIKKFSGTTGSWGTIKL